MTAPEKFKIAFEKSGITQAELADQVGVNRESVRLWLSGKGINGKNLYKVASILGVEPLALTDDNEQVDLNGESTLGERLRKLRVSRGLGQGEVSNGAGVSMALISRIENDHVNSLSPESIKLLSRFFNVDPSYFTEKTSEHSKKQYNNNPLKTTSQLTDLEKVISWKERGLISDKEFVELKAKLIKEL